MSSPTSQSEMEPTSTPRSGIRGIWDRFVGPETTAVESGLIIGSGVAFAGGLIGYALLADLGWTLVQLVLVAVIAFDIAGGIAGNTTLASTRWWHRPSQRRRDHFLFAAVHGVHLLVLAAVFTPVSWGAVEVVYGYLIVSTAVVLVLPKRHQQPVATTLVAGGILLSLYGPSLGAVFAWVAPFLYVKLVLGHSVGTL